MPTDVHLTNAIVWTCTAVLLVLDVLMALLVDRMVGREQFLRMRKLLAVIAGFFFLLVWSSVLLWAWDWFYAYIFPPWARYALPLIFAIGYGLLAVGMRWLSFRLPFSPALTWCVLGGLEGLLSHLYAIFGLGAASKPPIMQGTNPFVVLVFAIFEKAFYWSLILLVTYILSSRLTRRQARFNVR